MSIRHDSAATAGVMNNSHAGGLALAADSLTRLTHQARMGRLREIRKPHFPELRLAQLPM